MVDNLLLILPNISEYSHDKQNTKVRKMAF